MKVYSSMFKILYTILLYKLCSSEKYFKLPKSCSVHFRYTSFYLEVVLSIDYTTHFWTLVKVCKYNKGHSCTSKLNLRFDYMVRLIWIDINMCEELGTLHSSHVRSITWSLAGFLELWWISLPTVGVTLDTRRWVVQLQLLLKIQ